MGDIDIFYLGFRFFSTIVIFYIICYEECYVRVNVILFWGLLKDSIVFIYKVFRGKKKKVN